MRLNCSLVSSLLFVSAVLAGYHQPPILDHVEKSINSTDLVDNTIWAGALSRPVESVEVVEGIIKIPRASGPRGSAFNIVVAINGRPPCREFILRLGITVNAVVTGARYKAWAQGFDGGLITAPDEFVISTKDRIRFFVKVTSHHTEGVAGLINLHTNQAWYQVISGTRGMDCDLQDAMWMVTKHPHVASTFPYFRPLLAFMDIRTQISGNDRPGVPDNLFQANIIQREQRLTATEVYGPFIIIFRLREY